MKIYDCMSTNVHVVSPIDPLRKAAEIMRRFNIGYVPVVRNDKIIGAITDRDIVIRSVADGMSGENYIEDVMSPNVYYCYEDQSVEDVADLMASLHIRRLPVINRNKRMVGVVSLGDLSRSSMPSEILKTTYQQVAATH